jgi:hypothetical protein
MNSGLVPVETLPAHMEYPDFEQKCKRNKNMAWRTWVK